MLSLVHFQYHSSRYRGSKLDTDCSKLLLILQKHLEGDIPPRYSNSDTWTDVCKFEAQAHCVCSQWENKPLIWSCVWNKAGGDARSRDSTVDKWVFKGRYSAVLSFKFSLSSQTESWGCRFSCCVNYSSRWAVVAALCMTYWFEWVHQPIFFDHLFNVMHLTAARYTYLHALFFFFYPLSVRLPSCMFIKYTPLPHPHLPKLQVQTSTYF